MNQIEKMDKKITKKLQNKPKEVTRHTSLIQPPGQPNYVFMLEEFVLRAEENCCGIENDLIRQLATKNSMKSFHNNKVCLLLYYCSMLSMFERALENSTCFTTRISNTMKFEFVGLYF